MVEDKVPALLASISLPRVHRPRRERSRRALNVSRRTDSGRKKSQMGQAVRVNVNPMYANQDLEEVQFDLDKP